MICQCATLRPMQLCSSPARTTAFTARARRPIEPRSDRVHCISAALPVLMQRRHPKTVVDRPGVPCLRLEVLQQKHLSRPSNGQLNDEAGTAPVVAFHLDGASVRADNLPGDCQAKSRAAGRAAPGIV